MGKPRITSDHRGVGDDELVRVDVVGDGLSSTLMTKKRADQYIRHVRLMSCAVNVAALLVVLVVVGVGYELLYWVLVALFHLQLIVCLGC